MFHHAGDYMLSRMFPMSENDAKKLRNLLTASNMRSSFREAEMIV